MIAIAGKNLISETNLLNQQIILLRAIFQLILR